jgi:hypothetical protein
MTCCNIDKLQRHTHCISPLLQPEQGAPHFKTVPMLVEPAKED